MRDWQHTECSKCGKKIEGYECKDWTTWAVTEFHKNYDPVICIDCYKELKKTVRMLYPYDIDSPLLEFYVWRGFDQFVQDIIVDFNRYGKECDITKIKRSFFKQIERGNVKIRRAESPNYLEFWTDDLSLFDEIDLPVRHSERV